MSGENLEEDQVVAIPADNPEDDFMVIEKKLGVIPIHIKNQLRFHGFASMVTLSEVSNEHIENIETFARTSLRSLIEDNEIKSFYNRYHTSTEKFSFLIGEKIMIEKVQQFCSEYLMRILKSNENSSKQGSTETDSKCSKKLTTEPTQNTSETELKTTVNLDENEEFLKQTLKNMLLEFLNNYGQKLNEDTKDFVSKRCDQIHVRCEREEILNATRVLTDVVPKATINCPLCNTAFEIKEDIYGSTRWNLRLAIIRRHFHLHFKETPTKTTEPSTNHSRKHKQQNQSEEPLFEKGAKKKNTKQNRLQDPQQTSTEIDQDEVEKNALREDSNKDVDSA